MKQKCIFSICSHFLVQRAKNLLTARPLRKFTSRGQNLAILKLTIQPYGHAPIGAERLTFVLQHAVRGLQHGLVEVLSEGLWCEPLQGPILSILGRIGLPFQGR